MTFKKMLLLAGMALAAIAFAAPASASALEWTDNGAKFEGEATDTLTGRISFGNPAAGQTKFGCIAHAGIIAHGETDTSTIESFNPTTATCEGEGTFAGCELESDSTTNLPVDVDTLSTNVLTLTAHPPIVIHNVYKAPCPIEKTTLTVTDLTIQTQNSNLTDAIVSGFAEAHSTIRATGEEVTQTVAVFGTMKTATDTLSLS